MYDIQKIRVDFPILQREVYGKPLVYLDNAATTQKPLCVLDAMRDEYLNVNANVHRGVHYLSQQATDLHEAAREKVRQFINARKIEEIIFTRGTTEAINLVASSFCESQMQEGDEVIVTEMEHHSNIVSWQLQAMKRGIIVKHLPITDDGRLDLSTFAMHLSPRTKLVSVAHVSNVLGTINPVEEIVFTRGTTEAINLVASSFCESQMQEGDEVLVTEMEHHSNIVSWQLQAMKRGIMVKHIPITDDGILCLDQLESLITPRTKIISVAHVSNVLGTVNPVEQIIRIAHSHDIPVLVDGAQSAPHFKVDVQAMDCDFFAFSGHKMYGPTGIGVLYGKEEWLEKLPPYQGGGEMIDKVTWEKTTFERLPFKFEAGTPDYIATHGLAKAIEYIDSIGFDVIRQQEQELTCYCMEQLMTIDGMKIYGPTDVSLKDAVVSFNVGNIHHLDMGTLLDRLGVAVRTGHHCAQPLMDCLNISGTVRASFALYNTKDEIDTLVASIRRVSQMF